MIIRPFTLLLPELTQAAITKMKDSFNRFIFHHSYSQQIQGQGSSSSRVWWRTASWFVDFCFLTTDSYGWECAVVFFILLHLEDILYMAISPPESFHKISPCNTISSEASALAFELEADENIWRIANTKTADMSEKTVGCRPHGGGTRHRVPDTHSPDNHTVILHNSLKKTPFLIIIITWISKWMII